MTMLENTRRRQPRSAGRPRPCVREMCAGKHPAVFTLTEPTVAAMKRIFSANKVVKQSVAARKWLADMLQLPECPLRSMKGERSSIRDAARRASCVCKRCDAGADSVPLNDGVSIKEQVEYVTNALAESPFEDACFRYRGTSRHEPRYRCVILDQRDLARGVPPLGLTLSFSVQVF